jgi:hypothetical protein
MSTQPCKNITNGPLAGSLITRLLTLLIFSLAHGYTRRS